MSLHAVLLQNVNALLFPAFRRNLFGWPAQSVELGGAAGTREIDRFETIAILGTVGIPANYGGFETLAENLARFHQAKDVPGRLVVFLQREELHNAARVLPWGKTALHRAEC